MMKNFLYLIAVFLGACASPRERTFEGRVGVQKQGPGEYMFVETSGTKIGYSALELEEIARNYVYDEKVPFEIDGAERNIWIQTDGSATIAKVYFSSGPGKPRLEVDIDRNGKVRRHLIQPKVSR